MALTPETANRPVRTGVYLILAGGAGKAGRGRGRGIEGQRKQVAQRFSRTLSSLARTVNDGAWKLHLQGTSWAIIVVIAKKRSMYRLGRWLTSPSSRWAQLFQALYAVRCPDQQDRPSRWPPWSINMVSAGAVDMLLLHAGLVERGSGS